MKKYIILSMSLLLLIEILACTKVPEKESEITSSSESGKILSSPPTSQAHPNLSPEENNDGWGMLLASDGGSQGPSSLSPMKKKLYLLWKSILLPTKQWKALSRL